MQRAERGPVRAEAAAPAGGRRGRTSPQEFSRRGGGEQKGTRANFLNRSTALLLQDLRTKLMSAIVISLSGTAIYFVQPLLVKHCEISKISIKRNKNGKKTDSHNAALISAVQGVIFISVSSFFVYLVLLLVLSMTLSPFVSLLSKPHT